MKEGLLKYYNQQSKSGARPSWGNPGSLKVGVGITQVGEHLTSILTPKHKNLRKSLVTGELLSQLISAREETRFDFFSTPKRTKYFFSGVMKMTNVFIRSILLDF
jgi:hypothetical protein